MKTWFAVPEGSIDGKEVEVTEVTSRIAAATDMFEILEAIKEELIHNNGKNFDRDAILVVVDDILIQASKR